MNITLVSPVPVTSLSGNRTTAVRWQRLLEELGHSTNLVQSWQDDETDVLIALHRGFRAPAAAGLAHFDADRFAAQGLLFLDPADLPAHWRRPPGAHHRAGYRWGNDHL